MEVISCFFSVLKNPIDENNWLVIQVRFAQKLLGEGLAFTIRTHVDQVHPGPSVLVGILLKGKCPAKSTKSNTPKPGRLTQEMEQKRQVQEELLTSNSPKLPMSQNLTSGNST
jgi:hypothetical protein